MVDRLNSKQLDLVELLTERGSLIAIGGIEDDLFKSVSYHRLAEATGGWVDRFRKNGLTPGSRVSVQAGNTIPLVAFLYGAWCAGHLPLLQSPRQPLSRSQSLIADMQCKAFFSDHNLDLPSGSLPTGTVNPAVPATALFTSGSTGHPQIVVHTLANHLYSAMGSAINLPIESDDRWLIMLPLSHVSGLSILFRCLIAGATALIARSGSLRDDDTLDLLPQVTRLSLVPAQLQRLLEIPKDRFRNLRSVLVGGQAASPLLIRRAQEAGIPVMTTYGSTEMASQVTTTAPEGIVQPGACGTVLPYRRLRVHDGEIEVGGRTLFSGYLTPTGIKKPALRSGAWFQTGDYGYLSASGVLTVTGRADAMFVSGGENIQPQEIEAILTEHPAIAVAVVVPAPDIEFGTRPVAFIEPRANDYGFVMPPEAELQQLLASRLARFKHPVRYYRMPVSSLGKPDDLDDSAVISKPNRAQLTIMARREAEKI